MKTKQIYCITLLSTFSKQELLGFKSFISSKTNLLTFKDVSYTALKNLGNALIDVCLVRLNTLGSLQKKNEKLACEKEFKQTILKHIFLQYKGKNIKYDENERNKLIKELREYLHPQAKLFLAFQQLKNDKTETDYLFLNNSIFNAQRFETFFKLIQSANSKIKIRGFEYFKSTYQLEDLKIQFENGISKNYSKINVEPLNRSTDVFYAINKLEALFTESSLNYFNQTNLDLAEELNQIDRFISERQLNDIEQVEFLLSFVKLYLSSLLTKNADELSKYYQDLDNLLHNRKYKNTDKTGFDKVVINNIMIRVYRGEDLYKEIFVVFKKMHQKKQLIVGNSIDLIMFRSVIIAACRSGKIGWGKKFYSNNFKYTPNEKHEHLEKFYEILFDFYEENFDKALNNLEQLENLKIIINDDYEVAARIYKIKCLYEVSFEPRFFHVLKKEKQFFIDSKYLNDDKKRYYFNFAKILENLIKIKNKENIASKLGDANKQLRVSLDKIEKQLKSKDLVCDKPWIAEKVEKLKQLQG